MKSKFIAIPLLLLPTTTASVITISSCGKIFPRSIEVTGSDTVFIGQDDVQYEASIEPSTLSRDVYWTVDDESTATINSEGFLHAIKPGTVTIRARVRSVISSVIGIKDVHVCFKPEAINVVGDEIAYTDTKTQYKANVSSTQGETAQEVFWSVTDTSGWVFPKEQIDIEDGWLNPLVTTVGPLQVKIIARSIYDNNIFAEKTVTIQPPTPEYVYVRVPNKITLGYSESILLRESAMERNLPTNWEYDSNYFRIEADPYLRNSYIITPLQAATGQLLIKGTSTEAKLTEGMSAQKYVSIVPPPESIEITGKSQLHVGDIEPYTQTVLPREALQDVYWMFPLEHLEYYDYADINFETGVVTAKKPTDDLDDKKITICAYSMVGIEPAAVGSFDIEILA